MHAMTPGVRIETRENPDESLQEYLWGQLKAHGMSRLDRAELAETAFLANVAMLEGEVDGGTLGHVFYGGYNLQLLWVRQDQRAQGLGRRLLERVEIQARERRCNVVFGFSFGFQAPDFYRRAGYTVVGTIDDYPPGYRCYFLNKRLA